MNNDRRAVGTLVYECNIGDYLLEDDVSKALACLRLGDVITEYLMIGVCDNGHERACCLPMNMDADGKILCYACQGHDTVQEAIEHEMAYLDERIKEYVSGVVRLRELLAEHCPLDKETLT